VRESNRVTLDDALTVWKDATGNDPRLADDLEKVRAADLPPGNPWAS
jgi:hypothetical protein